MPSGLSPSSSSFSGSISSGSSKGGSSNTSVSLSEASESESAIAPKHDTHKFFPGLWDILFMKYWKYRGRGAAWAIVDPRLTCPSWWPFPSHFDHVPDQFMDPRIGTANFMLYVGDIPEDVHPPKGSFDYKGFRFIEFGLLVTMLISYRSTMMALPVPFWIKVISCWTEVNVIYLYDWLNFFYMAPRTVALFLQFKLYHARKVSYGAYYNPWPIIFCGLMWHKGRRGLWKAYWEHVHDTASSYFWYLLPRFAKATAFAATIGALLVWRTEIIALLIISLGSGLDLIAAAIKTRQLAVWELYDDSI